MTKRINDTHYAYAVTAARVRQIRALDQSDLDRMIAAPSFASALSVLKAKGWQIPEPLSDTNNLLEKQLTETWDYLSEISPDPSLFHPFILKNDFHNLKAGIKSILSDYEADTYFVFPSTIPSEQMSNAIVRNEFGLLPSPFSELGREVYDILVRTENGQLSDIIIDRLALDETRSCAGRGADPLILALIEFFCAGANIKIAFRAARIGKNTDFLERAVSTCDSLDRAQLIKAASEGVRPLMDYLETTEYREGTLLLNSSASEFERWCDDRAMSMLDNVRYIALGTPPLVAFYLGKEAEVRNVRIILAAKQVGLPESAIRSRMRRLYV